MEDRLRLTTSARAYVRSHYTMRRDWSLCCRTLAAGAVVVLLGAGAAEPANAAWSVRCVDTQTREGVWAIRIAGTPWVVTRAIRVPDRRGQDGSVPSRALVIQGDPDAAPRFAYRGYSEHLSLALWLGTTPETMSGIPAGEPPRPGDAVWIVGQPAEAEHLQLKGRAKTGLEEDRLGSVPEFVVSIDEAVPPKCLAEGLWCVLNESHTRLLGLYVGTGERPGRLACLPTGAVSGLGKCLGPCGGRQRWPGRVMHTLGVPLRDHQPYVGWQALLAMRRVLPFLSPEAAQSIEATIARVSSRSTEGPPRRPTVDYLADLPLDQFPALNGLCPRDVIVALDGQPIFRARDLFDALRNKPLGSSVRVTVDRDGTLVTVASVVYGIRVADRPGDAYNLCRPRCFLGAVTQSVHSYPEFAKSLLGQDLPRSPDALLVRAVHPDSPAERAGLLPQDVILQADDMKLQRGESLPDLLTRHLPGENMVLTVLRQGGQRRLTVQLAEAQHPRAPEVLAQAPALRNSGAPWDLALGLTLGDWLWPRSLESVGVPVAAVDVNSKCEGAGVVPGDQLVALDDTPVRWRSEVEAYLESKLPNEVIVLHLARDRREYQVSVRTVQALGNAASHTVGLYE